jgi:periplasmic divalent cation tolerance protein
LMSKNCLFYLSCKDSAEADKIANTLLAKQLIACAKQIPVKSSFRWQGKIEKSDEVLLIMESKEDLFDSVEAEVAKLHSYDTFVLEAVPINKTSEKAGSWLKSEFKDD